MDRRPLSRRGDECRARQPSELPAAPGAWLALVLGMSADKRPEFIQAIVGQARGPSRSATSASTPRAMAADELSGGWGLRVGVAARRQCGRGP